MYCRKIRSAKKVYAFSLFLRGKVVVVEGKVKKKNHRLYAKRTKRIFKRNGGDTYRKGQRVKYGFSTLVNFRDRILISSSM